MQDHSKPPKAPGVILASSTHTWLPGSKEVRTTQAKLLKWFQVNQRRYPWRETRDPYRVLIAEKLLQQTAARDKLVAAYREIVSTYPSPAALASAKRGHLTRILRPLGLHYRGEELRRLGGALCIMYRGKVPSELTHLVTLPGVGDYIARAVRSFAFNIDCPVVDGNVARILYRLLLLPGTPPPNPARSRKLLLLAGNFIPRGRSREYNLALIDLAAAVCTARQPRCPICPLVSTCDFANTL